MKLVEQRVKHDPENGEIGDCFLACLATVFGMELDDIPKFNEMMFEKNRDWAKDLEKWLESLGLRSVSWYDYRKGEYNEIDPSSHKGIYLASGPSPRFPDVWHTVVYKDGKLLHDPHPDKTGIPAVHQIEAFLPLDISEYMRAR